MHETWTDITILVEFKGQTVGHYADNKGVVCILGNGSRQPKLQKMALEIYLALRKFRISLHPVWITRDSDVLMF